MSDISKEVAESLWSDLREAFSNAEATIARIIETRAWEPLGYSTFPEAWTARMAGVRLATEAMRASVVYEMFSSGLDDREVVHATGGQVGDAAVTRLREQYDRGVPSSIATTRVRSHERSRPSQPEKLHVTLTHQEVTYYRDLAEALGLNREKEAAKAIRAHFRRLERANARIA